MKFFGKILIIYKSGNERTEEIRPDLSNLTQNSDFIRAG